MMNCDQARRFILLSETGELNARAEHGLKTHAATCAGCRQFQEETRRLTAAAQAALSADGPGPATLDVIRAAAEHEVRARIPHPWRSSLRPLAWAAGLALLLGGWAMGSSGLRARRINDVGLVISLVSDVAAEEDAGLQDLARQLLEMEGLEEETTEEEPVAPAPTTLRSRSSAAFLRQKCV